MPSLHDDALVISGIGVSSAIAQGGDAFLHALLAGEQRFDFMKRPGRQYAIEPATEGEASAMTAFIGAEIGDINMPPSLQKRMPRQLFWSTKVALATANEAWQSARLSEIDPQRLGLIVGGSNFSQREMAMLQQSYRSREAYINPTYAMTFMDTDLCGVLSEYFGIHGVSFTVGGASASGLLAIIQAAQAVASGQVDVCLAVGPLMDISHWEIQAFRNIGAMGSDRFSTEPTRAARPFDASHDGFIFGENCGVVVIERMATAQKRDCLPFARLAGWGMAVDGNRQPNPSLAGEISVIQSALKQAELQAKDIDYVNPHGTGSIIGDATELSALRHCQLNNARINATKSLIGHGLTAAGMVEVIATLLQMKAGQLHPTRNLVDPIDESFQWVREQAEKCNIRNALKLSMGFGGINTAICLSRVQ